MKTVRLMRKIAMRGLLAALTALLAVAWVPDAHAQYENKPMAIGSLHHMYNEIGGETEYWWSGYGLEWPAQFPWKGNYRAGATWVAVKNLEATDDNPLEQDYPVRVAHVGPRATGQGEYFPVKFETVSRIPATEVTVDGLPSYQKFPDVDRVDPTMTFDRKIINVINSITGITLKREIKAFSQETHDDYHVVEYTLTNTGQIDGDDEQELNQTIEGVFLHLQQRYGNTLWMPGNEWGANVVNDVVGDGIEDYETDLRAQFTWLGNSPGANVDPYGAPFIQSVHGDQWFNQDGDTARLITPQFFGTATVFAPGTAGSSEDADNLDAPEDPTQLQPYVTGFMGADHGLLSANSPFDIPKMQREYDMISGEWAEVGGHMYPHHVDLADTDDNLLTPSDQGDPKLDDSGGQQSFFSYGPYTLAPGDSVKIVVVQGAGGLSRQAALAVGRGFAEALNSNVADPALDYEIPFDADGDGTIEADERMSKNAWYMTGRDSLFNMFNNAISEYQTEGPPPRAPLPPSAFHVTSGVDEVAINWSYEYQQAIEPTPDHFAIYRAKDYWYGNIERDFEYEKIAEVPYESGKTSYSYADTEVQRGIEYFYYLEAVDADGGPMGKPLASNRMYTQTYTGASLKRPPGEELSDASIVPNPYVISAEEEVTWTRDDQIAFLDVPGQAVIRIFTETGELVKTIEHTDGSGDAFWNLETEDRQIIVSGIYLVTITDTETGETIVKKLSVVR